MRRVLVAAVLILVVAAACGSNGDGDAADGGARVETCVDRLLQDTPGSERTQNVERYARETYCERFDDRGWLYDDGALKMAAYTWLQEGGEEECAEARPGEAAVTIPCPEREPGPLILDCGILRHVRKNEVQAYIEQLRREGERVECDHGIRVGELGVP